MRKHAAVAWVPVPFDNEPLGSRTEFHRALVRHSAQVRVGAILVIVFAIGQIVYLVATGGALGWSLGGSISLITSPCLFLFLKWSASSHIETYDNARHNSPGC